MGAGNFAFFLLCIVCLFFIHMHIGKGRNMGFAKNGLGSKVEGAYIEYGFLLMSSGRAISVCVRGGRLQAFGRVSSLGDVGRL